MGVPAHEDITGKRYGSWTVESLNRCDNWRSYWNCVCDCGNRRVMRADCIIVSAKNNYCSKCKPKNKIIDVSDLSIEIVERVRNRENGVFCSTIISDGEVAYGFTKEGICYVIDSEDISKVAAHSFIFKGRGYVTTTIKNKERYLHNLLLENYETGYNVDHIDQDKLNNRKSNFRLCSSQQNSFNKGIPASNTSGYKGVSPHPKKAGYWYSHICFCRSTIGLGVYDNILEAAAAYDYANMILFGEFSWQHSDVFFDVPRKPAQDHITYILENLYRRLENIDWKDEKVLTIAYENLNREIQKYGLCMTHIKAKQRDHFGGGQSGYKGVHPYLKRESWWVAKIRFNGKTIGGGIYSSAAEAAAAYDYGMSILHDKPVWKNAEHKSGVSALTDDIESYVLERLTESLSTNAGWRDIDLLIKARNKVRYKSACYDFRNCDNGGEAA